MPETTWSSAIVGGDWERFGTYAELVFDEKPNGCYSLDLKATIGAARGRPNSSRNPGRR